MRIVLFYSGVDSFNFFTDQIVRELKKKGHECFVLDLRNPPESDPHSYAFFSQFIEKRVDLVICFDGFGIKEDLFIEIWDEHRAIVANILMDHPLRFHVTMTKHPRHYLQFCCDHNHVIYVNNYFNGTVPCVSFLPHAGVVYDKDVIVPFEKRKYDILFSAAYSRPQDTFTPLKQMFAVDSDMYRFYEKVFENLIQDSSLTTEQAVVCTLDQAGWPVSEEALKVIFRCSESVDWAIRMYHRERVIETLANAGFQVYLLGQGWENHPSVGLSNVHHIDQHVAYAQTLPIMAQAKINLNVLPWFKAGTHDRIFNTLLQHSLPLTDPNSWITENFTDGVDISLYDLDHLEALPEIAERLLTNSGASEAIIENGFEKVRNNFTWYHCVDQLVEVVVREQSRIL